MDLTKLSRDVLAAWAMTVVCEIQSVDAAEEKFGHAETMQAVPSYRHGIRACFQFANGQHKLAAEEIAKAVELGFSNFGASQEQLSIFPEMLKLCTAAE